MLTIECYAYSVAARFIAHFDGNIVPIRALRNKLRRYGMVREK